jgi:hypothetical protein
MIERHMSDAELVDQLRRAAGIWFKNQDLLLLEELIRRYRIDQSELARHRKLAEQNQA